MAKYIFVVGGVMSGVGKGVAAASIGTILKSKGFKVTAIKADPYINVDAGTMNPTEHGEVFVTLDGDETDQDMGNYERFLNVDLNRDNYMTTGRVYQSVINKERNLEYEGRCVQVVPHIPEEIISRIKRAAEKNDNDFVITEIGGTVGEYENVLFLEAIRILKMQQPQDVCIVMVSYLPIPYHIGEMKTKPTQMAVRSLNSTGLQPDFILCRSEKPIDDKRREKLAIFCNIKPNHAVSAPDVKSIYDIPLNFEKEDLGNKIIKHLGLKARPSNLKKWQDFANKANSKLNKSVKIGIVGKYFTTGDYVLADSYISIIESVKHASWNNNLSCDIEWLSSDDYERDPEKLAELSKYDGIIVPGGFGSRGVEGKIATAKYCRENNIPYLGLCYGMQIATIEFARNVAGLKDANTTEINPNTPHPVIHLMQEQEKKMAEHNYGGSMRLGGYQCKLTRGSISYEAYKKHAADKVNKDTIIERHRHRYEFNNDYREKLEKLGLVIAGLNPSQKLVEIIEIKNHPFFVGTQFHPELQSRPLHPHPLFMRFIETAANK
ncbi:MAG: CTP synthase [bacterium ADurb.Bin212]|nr:MAG: CTP synthase [bacterium ADurb.Bin212]